MPDLRNPLEGGLRDRLVFESFHRYLRHGLSQRGWFNDSALAPSGVRPITLQTVPAKAADKVEPNLITVTTGPMDPAGDAETGSGLSLDVTEVWVTIYAQSDGLGRDLQGDCYAILAGKLPSIGAETKGFQVYDWRQHPGTIDNPDWTYPPDDACIILDGDAPLFVEWRRVATDREHDPTTGVERNTWYVLGELEEYR